MRSSREWRCILIPCAPTDNNLNKILILKNSKLQKYINIIYFTADVFPKCPRRSPNFDKCMIKMMNTVRPRLASGRLSRDWMIDSVDPFYLNETDVTKNELFTFTAYDIYMSGTTNFDLKDIKYVFIKNKVNEPNY